MARTAKQKAAKERYTEAARNRAGIVITGTTAGVPDRSWWTEPKTREEFDQAVAAQRDRMTTSNFGQTNGTNAIGPGHR